MKRYLYEFIYICVCIYLILLKLIHQTFYNVQIINSDFPWFIQNHTINKAGAIGRIQKTEGYWI